MPVRVTCPSTWSPRREADWTRTSLRQRRRFRPVAWPRHATCDRARVRELIAEHTTGRTFGLLGEPRVNVLTLNLALDNLALSSN